MMGQRQREQVQRGCAVGTVVLLAWLCRVLPLEGMPSGLQEACGILRSLLYLSLFAGWGISLYNRTVHPQVRRLLLNVDLLMLFWILVRTLRFQLNTPPEIDRMLGYLYYAPMLGIPVLCVQLVLTVDRSERYRLSAWARMLWLPSAVQLDEHTLLRSAPVQGGYVMWQTDITELVENMERLKENRTELAERNYLEQQNYEVERKINALREKNRLYDLLQRQLAPQIIRMDQLLTRYRAAPEEEKRQLLGQVAVLGAYLKRGANLMFLAQQHRYVPSAELRYALEESISSLELAGVECAMEVTHEARLPAEAAAACYSRFESVVEGALGQLDALFVRAIWKDHRLNLYLSVETGADLKAACPAAVQEAPGSWVLNDHFEGGAPECGTN